MMKPLVSSRTLRIFIAAAASLAISCGGDRTADGTDSGDGSDVADTDRVDGVTDQPDLPVEAPDMADPDAQDVEVGCEDGREPCGGACCTETQLCFYDLCIEISMACTSDDDCGNDSYCDPDTGYCVPYGSGPRDAFNPDCTHLVTVARFSPLLQCSFEEAPEGDPYPAHVHVLSTPLVVDFNFNDDEGVVRPSIVATFDDGVDGSSEQPTGLIRILSGRNCELQYNLDRHMTSHSSPPAVGDLDLDGTPEVVAYSAGGGLIAFTYDRGADAWDIMWESTYPDDTPYTQAGGGWAGPSIHDLDDDGVPEVLRGGVIFDANGVLLGSSVGYKVYNNGIFPVVADVDLDGRMELVTGNMIYEYDEDAADWAPESYFTGTAQPDGHTAVGEFGEFPLTALDPADKPEVVVISEGEARLQTIEGTTVFGGYDLPDGGSGGPPTIADFDGDGRAEFALAGRGSYTVFDLDCVEDGVPSFCASGRTDGILWTVTSQDFSSSVTGSSVFDFEGDGNAEAIYADECFVRVYDGTTGDVIYSQYRSSCTWYENPIVADCDGDFNSELIVPSNKNCSPAETPDSGRPCEGLDPGDLDPQFPGLRCELPEDCASGRCDSGYCRCDVDDDCCAGGCGGTGFVCATPIGGTPGTGDVCRAAHPEGVSGIRVYMDAADHWVDSRPVWSQHAYHVTHVENNGAVVRTSDLEPNWLTGGLNNFRQNVMGDLEHLDSPDLTSGRGGYDDMCDTSDAVITLEVLVCNRGTQPVDIGITVGFYDGNPEEGGALICSDTTETVLVPGDCEAVSCDWTDPPLSPENAVDIWVEADSAEESSECFEGNNWSVIPGVYCEIMG
ncbi:MAG: hypothetical protein ABIJ56_23070 [Pseudomonadota bacterium]